MASVHVIANQKGGVGKTTLTVNLAAVTVDTLVDDWQASTEPSPVLVVSTDPQASAVWWSNRVANLPFDFVQAADDPGQLAKLRQLPQYEHVFVDTPGSLQDEELLTVALDQADDAVVPMPPEPLTFDPTARTIARLIEPRGLPYLVVVNIWDARDGEADLEQAKAYIAAKGWPAASKPVRRYKLHTRAAADGQVCTQYPGNRVALEAQKDFYRLALALGIGRRPATSARG